MRAIATRRAALGAILAAPLASVPAMAETEYAHHREVLLHAWEQHRLAYPYLDAKPRTVEEVACTFVMERLWQVCREIVALPPPKTLDGMVVVAMAAAVMWEGEEPDYTQDRSAIALIRAVLSASGTAMPRGFCGFGDEPDCSEREDERVAGQGVLPAWALARAEAKLCA